MIPSSADPQSGPPSDLASAVASAVDAYRRDDDLGTLLDRLRRLASASDPVAIADAAASFRDVPEVVIPLYEQIVAARPDDAQALVVLANAYWLTGRGPDIVGALATRARQADPANRGAWHLWALAEPTMRERVVRWQHVAERFPDDQLARAALADNAASLAGAEGDAGALELAIATYESLLAESTAAVQRRALETALTTLRRWRV